ncbi:Rieske (2Fe-2S) protein [Corynebacterium gerontici]|uniref:Cytochrome bc1 complex Rieske iron-sulfur subunit n=1 Tax=Corynebacterium gerontici TaxID=2079234 RepID=A0A3G6J2Y7_9CORY|nr:Rieske (2Fe-2S) protein [Corynebacterium gerontici]AZA12415.1 3-phenylpropionate dioxygenase ferredoxin subunit [Corynebacterium gerontici]
MTSFQCDRRTFLIGSATTFAGALLVACGRKDAPKDLAVSDVPVGSAVIVDKYIIAQPKDGEYKAYSTVCPHQGAPITIVEGSQVKCTKHGSVFDISDGHVVNGPAQQPLQEVPAKVEEGKVHVSE